MWGTVTSVISEPDELGAAIGAHGPVSLLVTRHGRFQARVTRIKLHSLCLFAVEESLPRIASIKAPADKMLIVFSVGDRASQIWGGIRMQASHLVTLGPGHCVHARAEGSSHWGAIWFPMQEFARYGRALTGDLPEVPGVVCHWRPPPSAFRELRQVHAAAIRVVRARSGLLPQPEAAHGLEQQLIHALIECLSAGPEGTDTVMADRHQDLLDRFEALLKSEPEGHLSVAGISAALRVSDRLLRRCCEQHLGVSPTGYLRLRRMQLVHRDLRCGSPNTMTVAIAAQRYGFHNSGRFASIYREQFGELPSVTLRQGPHGMGPGLAPPQRTRARRDWATH
jgi:AraC-like DNA-binding protein